MLLVKLPLAVPSVECEPVSDGLCEVPQHTPLATMVVPPFEEIFPPADAEVRVIPEAAVVDIDGGFTGVVKVSSLP